MKKATQKFIDANGEFRIPDHMWPKAPAPKSSSGTSFRSVREILADMKPRHREAIARAYTDLNGNKGDAA
jgi:hypothetical protein